jgi:hypothetical protein
MSPTLDLLRNLSAIMLGLCFILLGDKDVRFCIYSTIIKLGEFCLGHGFLRQICVAPVGKKLGEKEGEMISNLIYMLVWSS